MPPMTMNSPYVELLSTQAIPAPLRLMNLLGEVEAHSSSFERSSVWAKPSELQSEVIPPMTTREFSSFDKATEAKAWAGRPSDEPVVKDGFDESS